MSDAPPPESPAVDAIPDWSSLPELLPCLGCGYNLRMLPRPRCPECGVRFTWSDVIVAAQRQRDSTLFEHQWRTRPFRSLLDTTLLLLRPWRFWRDASLDAAPRLRPLAVQLALMCLAYACVSAFVFDALAITCRWYRPKPQWWSAALSAANLVYFRDCIVMFLEETVWLIEFAAINAVLLLMLRPTCKRYGIRWPMVARIFAYSAMTSLCYASATWNLSLCLGEIAPRSVAWASYVGLMHVTEWSALFMFAWGISSGLRRHFRLPLPWMVPLLFYVLQCLTAVALTAAATVLYDSYENPVTHLMYGYVYLVPWEVF